MADGIALNNRGGTGDSVGCECNTLNAKTAPAKFTSTAVCSGRHRSRAKFVLHCRIIAMDISARQ